MQGQIFHPGLSSSCFSSKYLSILVLSLLLLLSSVTLHSQALAAESSVVENASYKNLNPRPYDNCEANDLIKLSACCNDVLADLDDCKAGDLACECCALQSMDSACYNLCPGNPSTNFLAVLFDDCSSLNDVNACNIPFKRVDGDRPASFRNRKATADMIQRASSSVKSQMMSGEEKEESARKATINPDTGDTIMKQKPRINLISNVTYPAGSPMRSSSITAHLAGTALVIGAAVYLLFIKIT